MHHAVGSLTCSSCFFCAGYRLSASSLVAVGGLHDGLLSFQFHAAKLGKAIRANEKSGIIGRYRACWTAIRAFKRVFIGHIGKYARLSGTGKKLTGTGGTLTGALEMLSCAGKVVSLTLT